MSDPTRTVFRVPKDAGENRFARIANTALQDPRLSFRARGVLAYVMSMPDHWRHSAEALASQGPDGEKAVLSALRELEAAGYSSLHKSRTLRGTVGNLRTFSEEPTHPKGETVATDPLKPAPGQPTPQNGETVNRPTLNRPPVDRPVGFGGVFETTIKKQLSPPAPKGGVSEDLIAGIYAAYPRKVGRDKALAAIRKAVGQIVRNGEQPDPLAAAAHLLDRVTTYAEAKRHVPTDDRRFIPHPATWFNAGSYADDPTEWKVGAKPAADRSEPTITYV